METQTMARYSYIAAVLLFTGIITSGLPANLLVYAIHPQPLWIDIETYAANFHPIQMLPIWAGFLMLIGFTGLMASVHYLVSENYKFFTLLAIIATTIYAALIGLNYMLQLAVLQPAIETKQLAGMAFLAFGNPHSVTMAIEMLGYGFQGAATWLIGYVTDKSLLGRWIRWLGITNGLVSIAGMIIQGLTISMAVDHPLGLVAFLGWNVLFTVLCLLYVIYFKRKLRAALEKSKKHAISHT